MSNDKNPPSKPGDYEKLKKKLAIEEGKSHIKAYPGYPVDDKGKKISDMKTSKTVTAIAGKDLDKKKEIRVSEKLAKQYGGKPEDWVKLSSNARDINDGVKDNKKKLWEVHGYKNKKTGQVEELKSVDVNKRSTEAKQSSSKKIAMNNTKSNLPQKGELTKQFNKNAQDATKKTETKAETPKKPDFEKKGELPKKGELTKKFNENASEMAKKNNTEKKGETKKGDPPPKAELKPRPGKPNLG